MTKLILQYSLQYSIRPACPSRRWLPRYRPLSSASKFSRSATRRRSLLPAWRKTFVPREINSIWLHTSPLLMWMKTTKCLVSFGRNPWLICLIFRTIIKSMTCLCDMSVWHVSVTCLPIKSNKVYNKSLSRAINFFVCLFYSRYWYLPLIILISCPIANLNRMHLFVKIK